MTFQGKVLCCGMAALFALAFSLPAAAKVVARVDGVEITDDDIAIAMADVGPTLPADLDQAARRAYVVNYLIDQKLVAEKAKADKLESSPDFARQMAYYRDKILMQDVLGKLAKKAVTDAALHKVYDDAAKAHKPQPEVHARHILVATEAEATAALARVKKGEDFGKVADEVSKDRNKGGDLGWFTKDQMPPALADTAFKLKPGEISDPVKTPFGWQIIQVEEVRQSQLPPFDAVKGEITRFVMQKAQSDFVADLRKRAKIERTDAAPALPPGHPASP